METGVDTNARYRQPPRPPVRPFPNPTPQREGLVKRLPTWSSRRAIPHTVPGPDSGTSPVYAERPPDWIPEPILNGTFGKIVATEEPIEAPYPFHHDIPAPMPYTNGPKQYISGNITRKLPGAQGPLRNHLGSASVLSIPSSIPRSIPISVQSSPVPEPPSCRLTPSSSVSQQMFRQAPPLPAGPPQQARFAPPVPARRPESAVQIPAASPGPTARRTRRPPPPPGRPTPNPPPPLRHPTQHFRVAQPSSPNHPVPWDHPLFSGLVTGSNPDLDRANWFRNKLADDLEETALNDPTLYSTIQVSLARLDSLIAELSMAHTDDEYSATVAALEEVYQII